MAKHKHHKKHHHKKKHHKKHHTTQELHEDFHRALHPGRRVCPQSKYDQTGYNGNGTRHVCKGDHSHPYWERP